MQKMAWSFGTENAAEIRMSANNKTRTMAGSSIQRLSQRLSIRIVFAITFTAILAVVVIAPTYDEFTQARQNLHDIQEYRLLLDAANLITAERGPANIVMSEEPSPDGSGSRRLQDVRLQVDAALNTLAALPEPPFGIHNHPIPSDQLGLVRARLEAARTEVDRLALRSRATLTREEFQGAIDAMFAVSDSFRAIVASRANELVHHDTGLAASALIGQMLTDLRDYGGRMASQIIAPLATNEPIPLSNLINSRQTQGRLLELWQVIGSQNALYNAPLAEERAAVQQRFFGDGVTLIDKLIYEGGRGGGQYSLTATDLTDQFVPTMWSIEAYRTVFLRAAVHHYEQMRNAALMTLATVVVAACAIFVVLVGLILSIRVQIFSPLFQAHETVLRLAEDSADLIGTRSTRAGDIHNLFGALEALQGKLQERESVTSRLRTEADTDGLTAVLNRRALDRFGQRAAAGDDDGAVCLILMDIDHFKLINDSWGHPVGDRVLIQTAELLRSQLRSGDIVARFGGEEFAIVVPGADLVGAIAIGRKLRQALAHEHFTTADGTPFPVTASFGVARGERGPEAWRVLVEKADEALYRAKSEGRNRVRFVRNSTPRPVQVTEYGLPAISALAQQKHK